MLNPVLITLLSPAKLDGELCLPGWQGVVSLELARDLHRCGAIEAVPAEIVTVEALDAVLTKAAEANPAAAEALAVRLSDMRLDQIEESMREMAGRIGALEARDPAAAPAASERPADPADDQVATEAGEDSVAAEMETLETGETVAEIKDTAETATDATTDADLATETDAAVVTRKR